MADEAASQPSSVSAPLLVVASNDKGGFVAVITALAICFVLVAFGIRMYVRMAISGLRLDDLVLAITSAFSCVQSAIVFIQVGRGFGKASDLLDPYQVTRLQKSLYASDLLYISTLWLSKLCVGFLYLRVTVERRHARAAWGTIGISTLWAIISIFLISLRCHPAHPWTDVDNGQCSGFFARWQFVTALDIISEVALVSIAFYLVYGLQMSMKSKAIVVGAFAFRLPVIVAIALHLHYLHLQILSANPYLAGAYTAVCAQLELGYGIMTSSMPCLKPFMSAYEGPLRPPYKSSSENANSSGDDYRFTTYNTSSHSKKHNNKRLRSAEQGLSSSDELRGGGGGIGFGLGSLSSTNNHHHHHPHHTALAYKATVSHRDGKDARKGSFDSGDSRRMIIGKDMVIKKVVKWSVERDGDEPETDNNKPSSEPDVNETRPPQQPNP